MAQYIPKDALVAEITRKLHFINNWIEGDKRRQIHTNGVSSAYYKMIGSKHACENILDFVNTLEVKEVDLEKELHSYCRMYYNCDYPKQVKEETCDPVMPHIVSAAKHFFELGINAQKGE